MFSRTWPKVTLGFGYSETYFVVGKISNILIGLVPRNQ